MEATRIILFYSTLIFSIFVTTPFAEDAIAANQTIRDGVSTIESSDGVFELGFFSPGRSKNRYLGIWYKNISTGTVVWVANRETPVSDTSGVLRMDAKGSLVLTNGGNTLIWSSNSSGGVGSPMAQLLDTGNLVIRYANDTDPGRYIWQSFDHPGDQLLPGMKLGWDLQNGINWYLTSWTSPDDPSPGNYTFNVNLTGFPQPLVWRNSVVQFRFGPWDGIKFSGTAFTRPNPNFVSNFIFDQKEIYYNFQVSSSFVVMRGVLGLDGNINLLLWVDQTQSWQALLTTQKDDCDRYALCGSYGVCNTTKSQFRNDACGCLKGFEPKNAEKWKLGDWSNGCVRKIQLGCGDGDGFIKYLGQKLPDTRRSWFNQTMDLEECKSECLKNCSCSAYSNIDIREGGVGCMLWFDDLFDIRDYREDVPDLYVRVAAPELISAAGASRSARSKRKVTIIAIVVPVVVLAILLSLFIRYVFKKRKRRRKGMLTRNPESDATNAKEREDLDLPLCEFQEIADATNNFSQSNKLGEGGFGPVYRGLLKEGQEIAVKRLSKSSRQGLDEFKNEVSCIAKLQHRNLVKLLGCCIEEGEMLLIYEYMPNKSLDSLIFDKELNKTLDWPKRYNIINGIARGLLYLHQDSRLRIIHRDLKASNILLDYEMNPKISDFGMARSFRGTESEANTTRVVGTFGYMSPEYALDGTFSVKSDVYSFGVLVLEIVSGTKMRGYYHLDPDLNLLGHAWRIYKEGKFLELIDKTILESCNHSEVFRAVQIGLLCVQPYPVDRPTMSLVVLMLSSGIELPQPKQPAFITERTQPASSFSQMSNSSLSSRSITAPSPR